MRRVWTGLMVLLLAGGGYWLYRVAFPSDRVLIRRQVHALVEDVSFRGEGGSPLAVIAGVNRLLKYFTDDVEIRLGEVPGMRERVIKGRDELRELVAGARVSTRSVQTRLQEVYVSRVERPQATVQIIVGVRVDGDEDEFLQELQLQMFKVDGTWLIQQVEPIATLGF